MMETGDVERWRRGVRLEDGMTLPADATMLRHEDGKTWLELTIREGRNQQIRRMGEATGFRVMRLARTSFAGITSEGLRPGAWRYLTREELNALKQAFGVPQRVPAGTPGPVDPRVRAQAHQAAPVIDTHGRARASMGGRGRGRENAGGRGRENAGAPARAEASAGGRGRENPRGRGRPPSRPKPR
jgi:23S rRNA pseudouridine2605 synthase